MASDGNSKIFAFLAVFLGIIGFLIVLLAKKDDDYAMYYAKQSLIIFIGIIISQLLMLVLIGIILLPIMLILWILALLNALSGEKKPTPLIGKFADKINF
ncbi:MAG: DUF4870 domain-containing protein [archaeon]